MKNAYTGEYPVEIKGKKYTLIYDWGAISEVKEQCGSDVIKKLYSEMNPKFAAEVVMIGLKRKHEDDLPDMDAILRTLPPIPLLPLIAAVDKAFSLAYFGAEGTKSIEEAMEKSEKDSAKEPKKKPKMKLPKLLKRLFR